MPGAPLCQDSFKSVVPAAADVERQATSDDFDRTKRRDERSSTQYSHYMLKVTPGSLASVIRENVRQDAPRLIMDDRQCYSRPDASLRGSAEGWAKPESGGKQK
jgi:hypothetical protein